MSEAQEFIRTTRSRDCYDACGIVAPLSETQLTHLYNSHNQYFGEVQQEVGQMAREGFLLPSSARTIISQAQGADAP